MAPVVTAGRACRDCAERPAASGRALCNRCRWVRDRRRYTQPRVTGATIELPTDEVEMRMAQFGVPLRLRPALERLAREYGITSDRDGTT